MAAIKIIMVLLLIYPEHIYHIISINFQKWLNSVLAIVVVYIEHYWRVMIMIGKNVGDMNRIVRWNMHFHSQIVPTINPLGWKHSMNISKHSIIKRISVKFLDFFSLWLFIIKFWRSILRPHLTGYIRTQINELMVLCTPLFPNDSMLECSKNFRFCHGRNIMINFTDLAEKKQPWRYEMDVLKKGQIGMQMISFNILKISMFWWTFVAYAGGYCQLNRPLFDEQMDHMSSLQSWAPELRNFVESTERPIEAGNCDLIYEKPVFIMKIDASELEVSISWSIQMIN